MNTITSLIESKQSGKLKALVEKTISEKIVGLLEEKQKEVIAKMFVLEEYNDAENQKKLADLDTRIAAKNDQIAKTLARGKKKKVNEEDEELDEVQLIGTKRRFINAVDEKGVKTKHRIIGTRDGQFVTQPTKLGSETHPIVDKEVNDYMKHAHINGNTKAPMLGNHAKEYFS